MLYIIAVQDKRWLWDDSELYHNYSCRRVSKYSSWASGSSLFVLTLKINDSYFFKLKILHCKSFNSYNMFDLPFQAMVKLGLILLCWDTLKYLRSSWVSTSVDYKYFVTFIDKFSPCTWKYLMKECYDLFSIFSLSALKFKVNLVKTTKLFAMLIHEDISRERFHYFWVKTIFYISPHVLIHPCKMLLSNVEIVILLMLLANCLLHSNVSDRH